MNFFKRILLAVVSVLVVACNSPENPASGESPSPSPPSTTPNITISVRSAVSSLFYDYGTFSYYIEMDINNAGTGAAENCVAVLSLQGSAGLPITFVITSSSFIPATINDGASLFNLTQGYSAYLPYFYRIEFNYSGRKTTKTGAFSVLLPFSP